MYNNIYWQILFWRWRKELSNLFVRVYVFSGAEGCCLAATSCEVVGRTLSFFLPLNILLSMITIGYSRASVANILSNVVAKASPKNLNNWKKRFWKLKKNKQQNYCFIDSQWCEQKSIGVCEAMQLPSSWLAYGSSKLHMKAVRMASIVAMIRTNWLGRHSP